MEPENPPPFRLPSLYFLAFWGGSLPATLIAWVQAGRLGVADRRLKIVLIGLCAVLVPALSLSTEVGYRFAIEHGRPMRWVFRILGMLACWLQQRELSLADRRYAHRNGPEAPRASMWLPGVGALVVGSVATLIITLIMAYPQADF